jgi:hypothetical protein
VNSVNEYVLSMCVDVYEMFICHKRSCGKTLIVVVATLIKKRKSNFPHTVYQEIQNGIGCKVIYD